MRASALAPHRGALRLGFQGHELRCAGAGTLFGVGCGRVHPGPSGGRGAALRLLALTLRLWSRVVRRRSSLPWRSARRATAPPSSSPVRARDTCGGPGAPSALIPPPSLAEHLVSIITSSHTDYLIVLGDRNMRNDTCQARKNGRLVETKVCAAFGLTVGPLMVAPAARWALGLSAGAVAVGHAAAGLGREGGAADHGRRRQGHTADGRGGQAIDAARAV